MKHVVYLGADHAGFALKEKIRYFLQKKGYKVIDCGAFSYKKNDDYPDVIAKTARKVASHKNSIGIVFGKSGAGECIVANKVRGTRAVVGFNRENVKLARTHNNANVLSLGSEFVNAEKAKEFANIFLKTQFPNKTRHKRRIMKIIRMEK